MIKTNMTANDPYKLNISHQHALTWYWQPVHQSHEHTPEGTGSESETHKDKWAHKRKGQRGGTQGTKERRVHIEKGVSPKKGCTEKRGTQREGG